MHTAVLYLSLLKKKIVGFSTVPVQLYDCTAVLSNTEVLESTEVPVFISTSSSVRSGTTGSTGSILYYLNIVILVFEWSWCVHSPNAAVVQSGGSCA